MYSAGPAYPSVFSGQPSLHLQRSRMATFTLPTRALPAHMRMQKPAAPAATAAKLPALGLRPTPPPQLTTFPSVSPTTARRACLQVRAAAATAEAPPKAASASPAEPAPVRSGRPSVITDVPKTQQKPTVIITGASSGLGLSAARALVQSGDWHVIFAVRDFLKADLAAQKMGLQSGSYSLLHLDLSSLESVRQFVTNFRNSGRRLDVLVANAAVYLPTAKEPRFTADGFELSVGTNHLAHFLLVNELLEDLKQSPAKPPRVIIVGSITGNTNTLAGNVPPKANLGDLRGLASGLNGRTSVMIDGNEFDGAKAYKDSKVCNMLTTFELHRRYHDETGIVFSSLYPGCIAETGLFREHYSLFRKLFPPFQKYITKGYVSEEEAGNRLAQVVSDPKLAKSGVYWSWNKDSASFENEVSEEVANSAKGQKLWDVSLKLVGLE